MKMSSVNDKKMEEVKIPLKGEDRGSILTAKDAESPPVDHHFDEEVSEGSEIERGLWGSQMEFIMTCISYAGEF